MSDTISAICTAPGEGAIGIIRLSGPESIKIARKIFKAKKKTDLLSFARNQMVYGHIYQEEVLIDEVFCVYMRAPNSYTSEDVVEIHCHGGRLVQQKILALTHAYGARLAEPGEFTQRAFLSGRIDLTQAEAVMSVIRASSEMALKQAFYQQQGVFSQEIKKLRARLKNLLVETEAVLDYPEEDLEDVTFEKIITVAGELQHEIAGLLQSAHPGRIIKEGLRVVIMGKPNVGKSSLLNSLSGQDVAIVTEFPGTTRDSLEKQFFLEGLPLVLVDTAGIRQTADKVEQIGIERSLGKIEEADLLLLLLDTSVPLDKEDVFLLGKIKDKPSLILINKNDLPGKIDFAQIKELAGCQAEDIISVSILKKTGWSEFCARLKETTCGKNLAGEGVCVQEVRHQTLLLEADAQLRDALDAIVQKMPLDCILLDLRNVFQSLGMITGETASDEILREIFARFCLGK